MGLKAVSKYPTSALVSSVTGTAPIASSGGTTPAISIDPLFTVPRAAGGGTVDAITATYTPAITLANTELVALVSAGANATTTPTFAPNSLTAHTITARGGAALVAGDLGPAGFVALLESNLANTRWELLNPNGFSTVNAQTLLKGKGTTTNDSASAGYIGEIISSAIASAGAISAGGSDAWTDVTSIALTAGDWDVSINVQLIANGATVTYFQAGIGTVTGNDATGVVQGDNAIEGPGPGATSNMSGAVAGSRVSIATGETRYFKFRMGYSVATPKAFGRISARRVR